MSGLPSDSQYLTTSICFVVAGFGVKAGMVPLHVWLPLAHPAVRRFAGDIAFGVIAIALMIGLLALII